MVLTMGSTLYTQALSDKEKEKIYGESDLLIVPFLYRCSNFYTLS